MVSIIRICHPGLWAIFAGDIDSHTGGYSYKYTRLDNLPALYTTHYTNPMDNTNPQDHPNR